MQKSKLTTSHVLLPGSRRYQRAGSQVLARSDRQEWCEVTVKVRRRAKLPEPNPDKPIGPGELAVRYGANLKDLEVVAKVFSALGLSVNAKTSRVRTVSVAGMVSQIETVFGVRLFQVRHGEVIYRGRTGNVFIPKSLDGIVTGVFGLDTRPMVKRGRRLSSEATVTGVPPTSQRLWFFPRELATAYAFPTGDGSGQTIGILEFGGHYEANDLQQFWQLGGTSDPVPTVQIREAEPVSAKNSSDPDATGETMLDIEVAAAICPKATINVYFSNFTEKGWVANLDAVLSDKTIPTVVSVSYSWPEGDDPWTQQAIDEVNDTLKELANAGITVCASSGDDGSDDAVGNGMAHVGFPATSPYVLTVGGTSLNRHTGAEVVWREGNGVRPPNGTGGATGGGVSELNARPSWQSFSIVSVNPHAPQGRIIPDVSGNAALHTGYQMYGPSGDPNAPPGSSAWQTVGGTSASTPLWASLIALLQQAGKSIGFFTPRLYQTTPQTGGKPLGAFACKDITKGTNASGTAEGYAAGPGYDAASGWGSPNGQKFLKGLS